MEQMTNIRLSSAQASETALSVVSDWTPWAAALAPAAAIGTALYNHALPWIIIIPVAVAVELGGVLAGHTLTEVREYNEFAAEADRRKEAPLWWALGIYAAIGCVLSVLLDVVPELRHAWPVVLPLLAVVVYWVNGERLVIRRLQQGVTPTVTEPTAPAVDALRPITEALQDVASQLRGITRQLHDLSDRVTLLEDAPPAPVTPVTPVTPLSAKARVYAMLDNAQGDLSNQAIAEQLSIPANSVRVYRGQWVKERTVAAEAQPVTITNGNGTH
jgi:DNA-binding NarL/FixJ family response regulator